jgi:hypothetical protein
MVNIGTEPHQEGKDSPNVAEVTIAKPRIAFVWLAPRRESHLWSLGIIACYWAISTKRLTEQRRNTMTKGNCEFNGTGGSLFLLYVIHLMILPIITLGLYYTLWDLPVLRLEGAEYTLRW